jgi:hypothetical protein
MEASQPVIRSGFIWPALLSLFALKILLPHQNRTDHEVPDTLKDSTDVPSRRSTSARGVSAAIAVCVFYLSSHGPPDREKNTCLIMLDMPVEQIGNGHEGASLRNRSLIFFLCTGLYLPYELPNFALFTRKLSDKIESATQLMPAPPEHQSVFELEMKPQIGFQAGPCMHRTLVKFAIQRIEGQG